MIKKERKINNIFNEKEKMLKKKEREKEIHEKNIKREKNN